MPKHKYQHDELASVFSETSIYEPEKILIPEEQKVNNILPDHIFTIDTAPKDGTNIVVMENPEDGGVMAYWHGTRGRYKGKWVPRGRWSHTLTHMAVEFVSKYWKDADAVEWKIDNSIIDKARIAELEKKVAELSRGR